MKNNYNISLSKVLASEGGYTNDPKDSGGPTNFGITILDYRKYINSEGTAEDVRNMSVDQAKAIYRSKYWDALSCDTLPSGVDYTCFDYGVNSGLGRPRKALQRFKSLSGTKLIDAINDERTAFLKALAAQQPKNQKFLVGWLSRVDRVRKDSKKLAQDNTSGPVAGGGIAAMALALSQFFHTHQTEILISGAIAAVAIVAIIHFIKNR